jgi:xylose dehydrogenase (NAD/NADP)
LAPKLRWGVLGRSGHALRLVIPAIEGSVRGEVVAVGSRRDGPSYDDVLADRTVDAVYIPLPNSLHAEWTIRAAKAGKHVLCEKPMATTVEECERMLAACGQNGVLFMEGLMWRLHPQHARVKLLLADGSIGQPRLFRATFGFAMRNPEANVRLMPELGGGALWDLGVYCVDAARFLLGREPRGVTASLWIDPRYGVDTNAAATLDMGDGVLAEISASFDAAAGQRYELIGDKGRITCEDAFALGSGRSVRITWPDGEETFPPIDQYQLETDAFAAAVQDGAQLPIPPDAGVGNVRAIRTMLDSAGRR